MNGAEFFLLDRLLLLIMFLLVVEYFLQSEEILTCLLIQFLINILVNVDESGDHYML